MKRKIIYLVVLLVACVLQSKAQVFSGGPGNDPRKQKYSFSVAGSTCYSMFFVDRRASTHAIPRPGGGGMLRMDFRLKPAWLHAEFGMELLSQGCVFNTYYFAPGYSTLYDKSFGYNHKLRINELYIPLLLRIGFTADEIANENQVVYMLCGWAPKFILGASAKVVNNLDGQTIWSGPTILTNETSVFGDQASNAGIIGYGYERLLSSRENFISFETIFSYTFSRFIYAGNYDTNELLIKNACFSVQIGYRFMGINRNKKPK